MRWNVWSVSGQRWMMLKSGAKARAVEMVGVYTQENPGSVFEVRKVYDVMEQHGTTLMQFKPEAIWRMAMSDYDRRAGNQGADVTRMKHYNFHRDHVRKAKTANDILRAAIEDPARGRDSGKKTTRWLYSDIEQLKAALR